MSPEELQFVYKHAVAYGGFTLVVGVLVFLITRYALASYLSEKGKNLATREDIEEITRKVEAVRAPYNELLEELKARHQLRLAALDRRLQAHQEAFTLWRELHGVVHGPDVGPVVIKLQSWWEQNCLYLEPRVREAFVRAYSAAHTHGTLTRQHADYPALAESWKEITRFPDELFAAVQLPPLSAAELGAVAVNKST